MGNTTCIVHGQIDIFNLIIDVHVSGSVQKSMIKESYTTRLHTTATNQTANIELDQDKK